MRLNARDFSSKVNIMDFVPEKSSMLPTLIDKTKNGAKKDPMHNEHSTVELSDDDDIRRVAKDEELKLLRIEEERLRKEKAMEVLIHKAQADVCRNELQALVLKADQKHKKRKHDFNDHENEPS